MDIRQLRYFMGIADCGSMMKAAERLHVAQPALSVHINNMEVELGCKLLRRTNRGVELTEAGHLLYEQAKSVLKAHQDIIASFRDRRSSPFGTVSIGMPSTTSPAIGAELYRRLREHLPGVTLYITDASTAMLYEWLTEGRIDFAILFSLTENGHLDIVPLAVEEFCLASLADGSDDAATISFADLFSHRLVLPCKPTIWRKTLDDLAEKRGMRFHDVIETESASIIKSIILSGQASGILPGSYIRDSEGSERIQAKLIVNPNIQGLLSIACLADAPLNPAMRQVRSIVVDIFRQQQRDDFHSMEKVVPVLKDVPGRLLPSRFG